MAKRRHGASGVGIWRQQADNSKRGVFGREWREDKKPHKGGGTPCGEGGEVKPPKEAPGREVCLRHEELLFAVPKGQRGSLALGRGNGLIVRYELARAA